MRRTLLTAAAIALFAAPSHAQAPANNHSSSHPISLTSDQKKGVADVKKELIGVDYVVPFAKSTTAPSLLGVPFMRNEKLGVWALHIWTLRSNPSGMFAAWNPEVSCKNAAKAKF